MTDDQGQALTPAYYYMSMASEVIAQRHKGVFVSLETDLQKPIPAERIQSVRDGDAPDTLVPGWIMDVTPRAISVMFPPSYWERLPAHYSIEAEITALCGTLQKALSRVLTEKEQP